MSNIIIVDMVVRPLHEISSSNRFSSGGTATSLIQCHVVVVVEEGGGDVRIRGQEDDTNLRKTSPAMANPSHRAVRAGFYMHLSQWFYPTSSSSSENRPIPFQRGSD